MHINGHTPPFGESEVREEIIVYVYAPIYTNIQYIYAIAIAIVCICAHAAGGLTPPSRMYMLVAADSTVVLAVELLYTQCVLTNHRIGEVAFVTAPLLPCADDPPER